MKETDNHKSKTSLIASIVVIVAALLFAAWRLGFNPFSGSNEWQWSYEKTIITGEHKANSNPDIIQLKNGCYRIYSHGIGENNDGMHNIYSYYSCDGSNWEFEGARIKKAAMPAVVMTEDGKTRIYFQRGADGMNGIVTAVSDDGLRFTNEKLLLALNEGELAGIKSFAHLELVKTDNGFRMYFDETGLTPQDFEKYKNNKDWQWGVTRIRSLFSPDGLNWKLDPGIRIDYEQKPLDLMQRAGSCTVIKEGDKYHMFFNAGFSPWEDTKWWKRMSWSGVYEAVSTDGLNWEIIDNDLMRGSDPKIIKMGDKLKMLISEDSGGESTRYDGSNSIGIYVVR